MRERGVLLHILCISQNLLTPNLFICFYIYPHDIKFKKKEKYPWGGECDILNVQSIS